MMVNILRKIRGSELGTGVHDLPRPLAVALIEAGHAERIVETATSEAPENAARWTQRPRNPYVSKH